VISSRKRGSTLKPPFFEWSVLAFVPVFGCPPAFVYILPVLLWSEAALFHLSTSAEWARPWAMAAERCPAPATELVLPLLPPISEAKIL
jgi:hypothetical protein